MATKPREARLGTRGRMVLAAILIAGVAVRVIALGRLPGINGDEAWYGVSVYEFLAGRAPFLRTPPGNLLNPFHWGPLLLLSTVTQPALVLLRIPAAFWGCLSVALAYPVLTPALGARTALLAAAFMAVSPTLVAQSRLGWDPSPTPVFALLAVAWAIRGRLVSAGFATAGALVVHPTNVFITPIVAAAWAPHASRARQRCLELTGRATRIALTCAVVGGALGLLAAPPVLRSLADAGFLPSIEIAVARVTTPGAWLESGLAVVELYSGVTTATSIAGPPGFSMRVIADLTAVIAVVLAFLMVVAQRTVSREHGWLLGGLAISIAVFHVVAGPKALSPGMARYGLFLMVPLTIVVSIGLDALASKRRRLAIVAGGSMIAVSIWVLIGGYFAPLAVRGGAGHVTYRTGVPEPKEAAFEYIRQASIDAASVSIAAEDWWVYWPLRYLAVREGERVHVDMTAQPGGFRFPQDIPGASFPGPPEKAYAVVFNSGVEFARLRENGAPAFTARDPLGRPILHVFALEPPRKAETLR